jgi:hypothetical protein
MRHTGGEGAETGQTKVWGRGACWGLAGRSRLESSYPTLGGADIDTGGEFIFLPARELREDQGQRE